MQYSAEWAPFPRPRRPSTPAPTPLRPVCLCAREPPEQVAPLQRLCATSSYCALELNSATRMTPAGFNLALSAIDTVVQAPGPAALDDGVL